MAEVTNNAELSKSAKRRAAKKARDEQYAQENPPAPAPEPVPEKKPKAKAAPAAAEPKAKAKEAPKAAAKPKAQAKKEEPAKAEPAPKAAAAKGKAAAKAAAAPEAAKPKEAAKKADPKAKAGAKKEAPPPAPEPKAQPKAKGKAKAEPEPAPATKAAAKPAAKQAAKQAAKPKAAAPPPEEKKDSDRVDLVQPFEMDDGTGGDWEQSTGLSKKQEKRKEKEEQKKKEMAIAAAQAKKSVPGMAPTNTVPGMMPAPKAASKEEIAAFMEGVKQKGAQARAEVEAEHAEKTSMHTAQIQVPENKIGIVIGPKGSKIKLIQEKTGVSRIDTSGEMFTIVGQQQAVEMAYAAIKELIEKGYCSMAFEDFKEEAVPVHPAAFPDLIGKGGVTIKAFKSELNVEITIPQGLPKNANTGTKKYKVTLAGKKDDVAKAKEVIEKIATYGYHELTHQGQTHEEIEVEPWAYKFLIGKSGSELRHIQNNYKVKVNIPREHSLCQNVVVVGTAHDVTRAKEYIDNVMWKAQNQPAGRQGQDAAIDTWGEEEEEDWMKAYIYKRDK